MPTSPLLFQRWGRLALFKRNRESIDPDSWVANVIRLGYQIEFSVTPPDTGVWKTTPIPRERTKRQALEAKILGLANKGAVFIIHPSNSHNLIRSNFFLAPKKPDLWRPILNLKPLNKSYISTKKFRMETLASISRGMWATSIDLKDAYLHIPIHADFQ